MEAYVRFQRTQQSTHKPNDQKGLAHLLEYIVRNPFSLSKIEYVESTGAVLYRSAVSHGKNKRNFKVFNPLTFIADITQHIPDKSFQLIRYYGWYSNRMRGDRHKASAIKANQAEDEDAHPFLIKISDYRPKPIPSPLWRECIRQVFEVDPLICPSCNAEVRSISFLVERQVIRKILGHLGAYKDLPERQRAPPAEQAVTDPTLSVESVDDGWPSYEEPWLNVLARKHGPHWCCMCRNWRKGHSSTSYSV